MSIKYLGALALATSLTSAQAGTENTIDNKERINNSTPALIIGASSIVGALLMGRVILRRRRKQQTDADSSFLESGGVGIDPALDEPTPEDIDDGLARYTPGVDLVSEAGVYRKYGRDLQAMEYIKEHLMRYPGDCRAFVELLRIYRDTKNIDQFNITFVKLLLSKSTESLNEKERKEIIAMGKEIDPLNNMQYERINGTK